MTGPLEQRRILVIDDDHVMRLSCRKILSKEGFSVDTFENGEQGLEGVARLKPDLIVVDLIMPGIGGMEVISRVHTIDPLIVVVVITGFATVDSAVEAMKSGAYDFLPKPFSPDALRLIVKRALEHRRLQKESRRLELEREILKRRFITFVSHQLQTPLVAVHQYLDVMKHLKEIGKSGRKLDEWIDRCLARTDEMLCLIKDWLTLSKLESGALVTERRPVELKPIILNTVKKYRAMAFGSRIQLTTELPEAAFSVAADGEALNVLFDNLIDNAIKYNKPDGRVVVTGELADGAVTVAVSDTGVGIAEEHRSHLFDEFFRVKGDSAGKTTGTGLGLPICRRIVSELGGSIECDSEPHVGSTFRVRLPLISQSADADDTHTGTK